MHNSTKLAAILIVFLHTLLFLNITTAKEKPLPATCQTNCTVPFGDVLGIGTGDVPAYSNCNSDCVFFSPNKKQGTYTGIKWQCVEYARRWLFQNKGVVYGDVDVAADIWAINYVTRIKDDKKIDMTTYPNGSQQAPQVGDLIVYAKAYLKTGHIAVISDIDEKSHQIKVIEQNYKNTKWPATDYAREIPYIKQDGKYWVLDAYVLGWKRVAK